MAFKLDWKTIGLYAFRFVRFVIKKALTIILWIFLIIVLIILVIAQQVWAAVGIGALVAIFYVIKYFRMKLKEEQKESDRPRTRKSSFFDTFKPPVDE